MKWFKHDSDAGNDAKLRKLRMKYGAQGYGIYWYCLELIARNVEKHNLTFELEHDAELIAEDFRLSSELVQEMMTYMVNLGLFENTQGVITCLKMSSRTDEYTQKLLAKINNSSNVVGILSGQNLTKSELIEEKRREEKDNTASDFENFYQSYPKKKNKADAEKAWKANKPDLAKVLAALSWQKNQPDWKKDNGQFIPYPATYIRAKAWLDEKSENSEQPDWMKGAI